MIQINKEEKQLIAERFPDVHIVRTMKGDSKRHHYYCEEAPRVLRFLEKMRNPAKASGGDRRGKDGGRYR